ncbi:MAG: Ig-like domain-containing protein [Myxococcaceae bacterium]
MNGLLRNVVRSVLLAAGTMLLACEGVAVGLVDGAGAPLETPRNTFYVSPLGNDRDGRSWEGAWTELEAIDWSKLGPGDQVLIDGGETSITYATPLKFQKSGSPGAPIVFRVADEAGRNGQVILHGGRAGALPFCGQRDFARPVEGGERVRGVDTNGHDWVILDGGRWKGLHLTGYGHPGVEVSRESEHLTFRNIELSDNGSAVWREDGSWYPFGAGVRLAGERILFERAIIRDNGGDGIRVDGGLHGFVLRRSWLYNSRPHPTQENEPFNVCAQPSGARVAPTGEHQHGFNVEDSVVGPGFTTGLLLADAEIRGGWGVMNDVLVKNSVLVSHGGASATANLSAMQPPGHPPSNWRLERVTSLRPEGSPFANVAVRGQGHLVVDSYFVGGGELFLEEPRVKGSCKAPGVTGSDVGQKGEPMYAKLDFPGLGNADNAAGFDLRFDEDSPCLGFGSTITTIGMLVSDDPIPPEPVIAPNLPPTVAFLAPGVDVEIVADEPVAVIATASDPDGEIVKVEFLADDTLIGEVTQAPFTLSWRPQDGVNTLTARAWDEDGASAESHLQLSAAGRPRISFEAESGMLSGGYTVANGCVRQTGNTAVGAGGRAEFTFQVTVPGTYVVKADIAAPSDGENSLFFNIDANPAANHIWDVEVSATPIEQVGSWRGNGTGTAPQFAPKTFDLAAGEHTLILNGREPNTCIDRIAIALAE